MFLETQNQNKIVDTRWPEPYQVSSVVSELLPGRICPTFVEGPRHPTLQSYTVLINYYREIRVFTPYYDMYSYKNKDPFSKVE